MSSPGAISETGEATARQRAALVKLLADEDPVIYRTVRETIIAQGPGALAWLREHLLSEDPVVRRRAHGIVRQLDRQEADNRFLTFCLKQGEDLPLEQGVWLLARTRYPEINSEAYAAMLDSYAMDIREEIASARGAKEVLSRVGAYLFEALGFSGNEKDYYSPENSYLNRVLDRRTGNPISLCVVYLLLARRLQLPISGIGLPGHFICRYQSSAAELYIDVFGGGKLLAKADCVRYLLQANYSVREEYLAPLSPKRILLRICKNLHQAHLHAGEQAEGTRFQRYVVALEK